MTTEFNIGDTVTYFPYEQELTAKVMDIQKGINGTGLHIDGSPDDRTFYKLSGKQVLVCCSGISIKESMFFNN